MALPKVVAPTYELELPSNGKKIKYGQYKEIKKCGHLIHLEKPEIFNKIIQDFILAL